MKEKYITIITSYFSEKTHETPQILPIVCSRPTCCHHPTNAHKYVKDNFLPMIASDKK